MTILQGLPHSTTRISHLSKRTLLAGLASSALASSIFVRRSHGQAAFPSRPINVVLGYAAGGGADILARYISRELETRLKTPVLVLNKPGAAGNIGIQHVVDSKPDGYTITISPAAPIVHSPLLFKDVNYNLDDFTPLASLFYVPFVVAVDARSAIKTFQDLVLMIRERKLRSRYGAPTTASRAITAYFLDELGLESTPVPYKSSATALQDLEGGELDFLVIDLTGALSFIKRDAIRLIAVASDKRLTTMPDLPSFKEQGLKLPRWDAEFLAVGPQKIPPDIAKKLGDTLADIMQEPETIKFLAGTGGVPFKGTGQETRELMERIQRQWAIALRLANIERQ